MHTLVHWEVNVTQIQRVISKHSPEQKFIVNTLLTDTLWMAASRPIWSLVSRQHPAFLADQQVIAASKVWWGSISHLKLVFPCQVVVDLVVAHAWLSGWRHHHEVYPRKDNYRCKSTIQRKVHSWVLINRYGRIPTANLQSHTTQSIYITGYRPS